MKNWSNQPYINNVESWYWGYGRLGPYSLVWFDTIDTDRKEYVSAYVSKDDKIIASSCTATALKVQPVGSPYPPSINSSDPSGYTINMDLGDEGVLSANLNTTTIILDGGMTYKRWAGILSGSMNGGEVREGGVSLYEQFKLV
jgi:hypothetical protein